MIIHDMTTSPSDLMSDPLLQSMSGVAELRHLGVILAEGPDAATFLQGQLTQDVATLGPGNACLAAFCNAKGRMQASFVVFKRHNVDASDGFLMVCSADILAQTLKRLSMFVMRAKVKLTDASAEFRLCGLAGTAIDSGAACAHNTWARNTFEAQNTVFLYPGAGIARALWCAPVGMPLPAGKALALPDWNWLEVQSGIAMITQPIFEAFVPQMLNYESVGGVSFKKGCYPGQEVVARSQFRGTLKRRAYLVRSLVRGLADGLAHNLAEPLVGQEVFHSSDADQPCGLVATSAANPAGGFDAIVSMQTSAAQGGTLTVGSAQGAVINLLHLPYPLLQDI